MIPVTKLSACFFSVLYSCFDAFKVIHSIAKTLEGLREMTKRTIQEFCDDGVVYLELRTTPKAEEKVYNKEEYIETVVCAIQ